MSKYDPLADYLRRSPDTAVEMEFDQVADLVGGLPPSAFQYRQWWANNKDHVEARAWLAVGRRVVDVNLDRQRVRFSRARPAPY